MIALLSLGAECAEGQTSTLPSPGSFRQLPRSAVAALTAEDCRIPPGLIGGTVVTRNVISGEFARKGQRDWAILCFNNDRAYIRLFWGGTSRCADRIEVGMQGMDARKIEEWGGYDLAISAVDRRSILEHYKDADRAAPPPPPITHQGIDRAVLQKTSVVHYCHKGTWLHLMGAD